MYHVRETLMDSKTWVMSCTTFCLHIVNGAVSGFGSMIVNSFGYSHLKSILMLGGTGRATGGSVVASLVVAGMVGTFVRNTQSYLMAAFELFTILGSCLVWKWIGAKAAELQLGASSSWVALWQAP
ncbi:hypothetical protein HRR80_000340 [Exophiala dermatitidis]|uniref:Uncharacterized protein n=1 Tax=Exophiala dermatitidis TaxID=5970 RepID=A0AAN6F399_EXODE|nr:hypothetical protein HRR80_000340 [Exophiala dermatitidis]